MDGAFLFALRAALAMGLVALPLALAGRPDLAVYAALGSFTATFGRNLPYPRRARILALAAVAMTACVGCGSALAVAARPGESAAGTAAVIAATGLVAGVAKYVCDTARLGGLGAVLLLFSFAVAADDSATSGEVLPRTALAAAAAGLAWLLGVSGHLLHPDRPERLAVATALRATAALLAAPEQGGSAARDPAPGDARRTGRLPVPRLPAAGRQPPHRSRPRCGLPAPHRPVLDPPRGPGTPGPPRPARTGRAAAAPGPAADRPPPRARPGAARTPFPAGGVAGGLTAGRAHPPGSAAGALPAAGGGSGPAPRGFRHGARGPRRPARHRAADRAPGRAGPLRPPGRSRRTDGTGHRGRGRARRAAASGARLLGGGLGGRGAALGEPAHHRPACRAADPGHGRGAAARPRGARRGPGAGGARRGDRRPGVPARIRRGPQLRPGRRLPHADGAAPERAGRARARR
ncbi:hypothetical protein SLNWT_7188 [Streptomyces albus]|uniref:Integral membrane protein n=1 Tax=Streptomyces albus (strain ATCC 21838 / DSM 41398 / FERM P-419 / JCM 4703 / NBRC 107858) TaxID=1081613 RepID=A0A0B5F0F6_STRA4|nr:hypothetical protein SLNWT_7188 [Streptomyces albus]